MKKFGPNAVFMDVDTIRSGADFVAAIDEALDSCQIVLAVIGQGWLTGTGRDGRRRIDDPFDYVAVEISTALRRSIPILPVLADGAQMPARGDLPSALMDLTARNAVRVDHESFGHDTVVVIDSVARTL